LVIIVKLREKDGKGKILVLKGEIDPAPSLFDHKDQALGMARRIDLRVFWKTAGSKFFKTAAYSGLVNSRRRSRRESFFFMQQRDDRQSFGV
jgi:hypothetical protein